MRPKNSKAQKSKSYFTILAETYQDFAENTSIHGLKYTVNKDVGLCEKVFWILVIILGLCGAAYMTVLFWERYISNPTRTTVFTAFAPTIVIPFPAVTICNLHVIRPWKVEKFMEKLSYNTTEEEIIKSAIPQLKAFTSKVQQMNETELSILQNVLEENNYYNMTEVMEEISQSCSEMLVHCVWNQRNVSCNDYFRRSYSNIGSCCSFNYKNEEQNPTLYSQYNGLESGIRVLVNTEAKSTIVAGLRVIVHYPSEYPGPQSDARIYGSGRVSYIKLSGTKLTCSSDVKKLPISQRHCLYPDEYKLRYFRNQYSDENCVLECEEDLYFKICNCVPFYFSFSDKPICNISKINCVNNVKMNEIVQDRIEECQCGAQCEKVFYELSSSSVRLLYSDSFSMMSFANKTVLDTYSLINIYFLSNRQTILLRETVTSTIYLLSSFGGVYSLFMGCSLVTIAELIYYGFFRFIINLKLFGKIDVDVKDTKKRIVRKKQFPNGAEYSNYRQISHIRIQQ